MLHYDAPRHPVPTALYMVDALYLSLIKMFENLRLCSSMLNTAQNESRATRVARINL